MRVGHYNSPAIESSGCKSSSVVEYKGLLSHLGKKNQGQEAANALKKNFHDEADRGPCSD